MYGWPRTLLRASWPSLLGGRFHYYSCRTLLLMEENSDLNLGVASRRRGQQYAALKHEPPECGLVFHLLPPLHKLVLCCHKHFTSCVALTGRTQTSGEQLVSFWMESATHCLNLWIFLFSFAMNPGLRLAYCFKELRLLCRFVRKRLLNSTGVTVHLPGVILTRLWHFRNLICI